ncbi:hypothetical protein [Lentzea tibetensis]|uniref:hypothetical protein n=1 Tax=Lentzea tibetensis TaxID=2591470 RepID=UPI0016453DB0|nr:hypothetical protein [Lentzea tibetensis]
MSLSAAVGVLERIFADPAKEVLAVDEVLANAGRDARWVQQNKRWLSNRLTSLVAHDLVESVHGKSRRLEGVRLTPAGKTALLAGAESYRSRGKITLEDIAIQIRIFESQNPSIKVNFAVVSKDVETSRPNRPGGV